MGKPNILLIMSDQHRFDCLGAYGNKEIQTPHIDKLASDGTVYRNSFSAAPVCTPSRYSVLTGLYPHQHTGWANHATIPAPDKAFPEILRRNSYRTKAVGKMHLTPTYMNIGFEHLQLAEQDGSGRYDDDYHRYLRQQGLVDGIDLIDQVSEYRKQAPKHYWDVFGAVESNLPEEHHSTTWIGNQALAALGEWGGEEPNFLMVSFIKPHHPFDPPAPWSQMYDAQHLTVLPGWTENCLQHDLQMNGGYFPNDQLTVDALKRAMALYYGSISHIDGYVGQMMELLKEKGLYDDTMIIYTSDHGEYLGFHHMLLKSNHMYDPLVKVPLIIKYPGERNKMAYSDELVNNIDLAPTLLKLADAQPDKHMAGIDLKTGTANRDYIICEGASSNQYMIRSQTHKLLYSRDQTNHLFFDLVKDPLELRNLYEDPEHRQLIGEFKEDLLQFILFDAVTPTHLNVEAAQIEAQNVPQNEAAQELKDWYRNKMESFELRSEEQS
ncbi:sulfatase [Paenibacillus thalictri]|uniref:Sulfatase N-terminal domain-containing protein n=1 Tax=Paenibacillus thalictri TaxID=2527873 RepID=A0A4V2J3S6_9BACL|nr:sulfatase-like hydrolase/transferase [Paenibacillus thalictri]TBL75316.1 hypothetical protein EYB31_23175 [Paenibacillus thalictri]